MWRRVGYNVDEGCADQDPDTESLEHRGTGHVHEAAN